MDPTEDLLNPAVVKVVTDARGDALYFHEPQSRSSAMIREGR